MIVPRGGHRSDLRWPLWASLAVVAHLFAGLALLPQLRSLSRRARVLAALPSGLLLALGLVSLSQRDQLGWISRPSWYAPLSGWSTLSGGWWLLVPASVGVVIAERRGGVWRTVALWAVTPIALLLLVSQVDPVYLPRYVIEATPALALLTAMALRQLATSWQRLAVAPAIAVGIGIAVVTTQGLRPFRYENLPSAADFIRDGSQHGDGVVYLGVSTRLALSDEITESVGLRSDDGPEPPDVLLATRPDAVAAGALESASVGPHEVPLLMAGARRLWVVSWPGVNTVRTSDPTSQAAQATLTRGWSPLSQQSFGSMRVTLWGRQRPGPGLGTSY